MIKKIVKSQMVGNSYTTITKVYFCGILIYISYE